MRVAGTPVYRIEGDERITAGLIGNIRTVTISSNGAAFAVTGEPEIVHSFVASLCEVVSEGQG